MLRSEKYEASRNLVLAYRAWSDEVKATMNRPDSIVFMDDLSNVEREGERVIWRDEFARAASSKNLFSETEKLKINQSIAFAEYLSAAPKKANVLACGGEFGIISESEIARLDDEISALQGKDTEENIDLSMPPVDFAEMLISSGMRYLKGKMPWLHDITTKISLINPESPFGAQVITDREGEIVCELRMPEKINPKFVDTLIHEFLGHVLHFTQLKNNKNIQTDCPHLLCLTLHTHEPFFIEGIAQALTLKMLKSDWHLEGKARVLLENTRFRKTMAILSFVLSNVLEGSVSASEAGKLHCFYAGDESELERFEKLYEKTLTDLFVTKIRLNYHQSIMSLDPLLKVSDERFYESLPQLLNNYYTPASLRRFVDECLE